MYRPTSQNNQPSLYPVSKVFTHPYTGLTRQETRNHSERVSSSQDALLANHEAAGQKQQAQVNADQVAEDDPAGFVGGDREENANNEPHPHIKCYRLVKLWRYGAVGTGVCCHDTRPGDIDQRVGPVQSGIGAEDGCAELGFISFLNR